MVAHWSRCTHCITLLHTLLFLPLQYSLNLWTPVHLSLRHAHLCVHLGNQQTRMDVRFASVCLHLVGFMTSQHAKVDIDYLAIKLWHWVGTHTSFVRHGAMHACIHKVWEYMFLVISTPNGHSIIKFLAQIKSVSFGRMLSAKMRVTWVVFCPILMSIKELST